MFRLHLTVLLCCSSKRSEKLTPLTVGISNDSRFIKNMRSFPTKYDENKEAWIT